MSQETVSDSASADPLSLINIRFSAELAKVRCASKKNSVFLIEDSYRKLMMQVEDAKIRPKKEPRHYWLLNTYDVMVVENTQQLIHSFI